MSPTIYTVYWDLLFILNFAFDLLILWLVSLCCGTRFCFFRALAAAAAGGLYGLGMLFPFLSVLYSLPVVILLPLLLLLIATPQTNGKLLLRQFISFFLLAFALSGFVNALQTAANKLGLPTQSILLLAAALGIAIPSAKKLYQMLRPQRRRTCTITLQYAGQSLTCTALVDTGNLLTEPISGLPAAVIDQTLAAQLNPALKYSRQQTPQELLQLLYNEGHTDFRLLPYRSIDKTSGLLLAFGPATLTAPDKQYPIFAAISPVPLGRQYQAIIPAESSTPTPKGDAI